MASDTLPEPRLPPQLLASALPTPQVGGLLKGSMGASPYRHDSPEPDDKSPTTPDYTTSYQDLSQSLVPHQMLQVNKKLEQYLRSEADSDFGHRGSYMRALMQFADQDADSLTMVIDDIDADSVSDGGREQHVQYHSDEPTAMANDPRPETEAARTIAAPKQDFSFRISRVPFTFSLGDPIPQSPRSPQDQGNSTPTDTDGPLTPELEKLTIGEEVFQSLMFAASPDLKLDELSWEQYSWAPSQPGVEQEIPTVEVEEPINEPENQATRDEEPVTVQEKRMSMRSFPSEVLTTVKEEEERIPTKPFPSEVPDVAHEKEEKRAWTKPLPPETLAVISEEKEMAVLIVRDDKEVTHHAPVPDEKEVGVPTFPDEKEVVVPTFDEEKQVVMPTYYQEKEVTTVPIVHQEKEVLLPTSDRGYFNPFEANRAASKERHRQASSMSTARQSSCTTRSETSLSSHSSLEDWGSNKGSPGGRSSNVFSRFRGRPIGRLFSDEEPLERRSLTPQELLPTLKQQDDTPPGPSSMTMKPLPPEPKVPTKSRGFFSSPLTTTTTPAPSDESLVFGVDLKESIRLAPMRARISHKGKSTSSRDFPLSIYKCCEFILASNPIDHNIFSTPGSTTNVFQLRTIFNTAPSYGENFSFVGTHFTPYDAASLILLYLSELPKPLVSAAALKGWVLLARQEGAIEPPAPRLLETGLDFWVDVLNRLPASNRSMVKHLLGLFAGVAMRGGRVDEAGARQLAAGVAGAVFQNSGEGDKSGKKAVHATLALAFLIKKRGEYELEVSRRKEKKEGGFLPSTREILEWKGQY